MKSIIFNTEMVKAVLDGRRSQFRKVIRNIIATDGRYEGWRDEDIEIINGRVEIWTTLWRKIKAKYKVGDILYVKETFKTFSNITMDKEVGVIYKADNKEVILPCNGDYECEYVFNDKWKPSVHMPKKYARIFLRVTNVRVEKIQDISMQDVLKEGVNMQGNPNRHLLDIKSYWVENWNSTAKDGYKWEDNPYVFAYEFEKINKED